MYPSNVTPEKLQAEKERVKALWIERNAQHNNRYAESQRSLTYSLAHANSLGRYGSLLWQEYDGVANAVPSTWPVEVLVGQQYCTEVLFGLRYLNAYAMAAVVALGSGIDRFLPLLQVPRVTQRILSDQHRSDRDLVRYRAKLVCADS